MKSDFDEIGKPASVPVQLYVGVLMSVMDFEFMVRLLCFLQFSIMQPPRNRPDMRART